MPPEVGQASILSSWMWKAPCPISPSARRQDPRRASISATRAIALADPPLPPGRACACPIRTAHFPIDALPGSRCVARRAVGSCARWDRLHDSFIIAAGRDGLWIIDQHVAHERILFEQVLKQRAAGRVEQQRLLMPLILQLTPAQQIEYARIADELNAIGFETEPFGHRTIAVKAAPAAIGPADLEKVHLRNSGDRRAGAAQAFRSTICAAELPRLPSPAVRPSRSTRGSITNKMEWLLLRCRSHGLSHELPARPADRAAVFHARHSEGLSSDLTVYCTPTIQSAAARRLSTRASGARSGARSL